jgi:hypothetical protein
MNEKESGYCFGCGHKFDDVTDFEKCPECGTTAKPCHYADDVRVWVNWKELMAICGTAEKASVSNPGALAVILRIASKLEVQEPKRPELTVFTFSAHHPPETAEDLRQRFGFGKEGGN